LLRFEHGAHQERNTGINLRDFTRRLKPVHNGHREVDDHSIRSVLAEHFDCGYAVTRLSAQLPILLLLDAGAE
jgi:hypothetical protein